MLKEGNLLAAASYVLHSTIAITSWQTLAKAVSELVGALSPVNHIGLYQG